MKVSEILDKIDSGSLTLPEFQRGYVWNRNQVRDLMFSLYKGYPIGGLLLWETRTDEAEYRGDQLLQRGTVKLILDGQQRITTLYGIIRGKPPAFFDGNAQAFTGLYFNLETEEFSFYMERKMKDNPVWINVTELMQTSAADVYGDLLEKDGYRPDRVALNRLSAIDNIKTIDIPAQEITGEDKTVDIVVDIFNKVNSGGTKLSKGDLALAKICAEWPGAREEMQLRLKRWAQAGYYFKLDWFLRNINAVLTGDAFFSSLRKVDSSKFQEGLKQTEKGINYLLNMISARLGLDHHQVLGSVYSFPVMSRYLYDQGGKLSDAREQDRLLFWYVHTMLWGRYAGSTETALRQDLAALRTAEPLDSLIKQLRRWRGDLVVRPDDFDASTRGARFYPLLYLLTRVYGAKDWGTGLPLSAHLLGRQNALQVHHIFPKSLLYDAGYDRKEVNAVANFCFLTQDSNLRISNRKPEDYFKEVATSFPGALESQWIPMDEELWKIENYRAFLAARRELLADKANQLLDELLHGTHSVQREHSTDLPQGAVLVDDMTDEPELKQLIAWLRDRGLPQPMLQTTLSHPVTGEALIVADAAWPDGLQEGYSKPVALILDGDRSAEDCLRELDYVVFHDIEKLQGFIKQQLVVTS